MTGARREGVDRELFREDKEVMPSIRVVLQERKSAPPFLDAGL